MKQLDTVVRSINKFCQIIAGCLVMMIFLVALIQVVIRKLGYTISWGEEMSRYAVCLVALTGAVLCDRNGEAIRIRALVDFLPGKVRKVTDTITFTIVFGFLLFFTYSIFMTFQSAAGLTFDTVTWMQKQWFYGICLFLAVMLDISHLLHLIDLVQRPAESFEVPKGGGT